MQHRKIVSSDEVLARIGARPRDQRTILCAGVFDVVHPGHLRHLMYAKSKADVLIAAVTSDRHIDKGKHRPHVPEGLRALNLAALEVVDFVLVDDNQTPVPLICALQPDYFAKGYEYRELASPRTAEEVAALGCYGGEIIFTPGDVVYSSSKLLEIEPPRLKFDKLLHAMRQHGLTFDSLKTSVLQMEGKRVHVVGDTIVDSIRRTTVIGSKAKTPTLSVLHEGREVFTGGAAVVAKHLAAAGATVSFSTVLGDDDAGRAVSADLAAHGISCSAVIDATRPTTCKEVVVAGGYRLLKIDTVDNRLISEAALERLCRDLGEVESDAVVFSDFRHGIFSRRTIQILADAIRAPYRVADSQVASRWGNVTEFKGFDLITPNEHEARFALGDQDSGIRPLAQALYEAAGCRTMLLKLGERGVLACEDEVAVLDSFVEHLVDPVGAGDALLAYATLAMLVTRNHAAAGVLGSVAAALECEVEGNAPVTPARVLERLARLEEGAGYGSRN